MSVQRPVARYLGGKWILAPWIVSHFPAHDLYLEPYGGLASVLLRKARSRAEVYNDIDGEVVNLFRVLRDRAQAQELVGLLALTPYARAEFDQAWDIPADAGPVERARLFLVRAQMGYGTAATGKWRTGFRASVFRDGSIPAEDWARYPAILQAVVERLQGVVIENLDALEAIQRYDSPGTLHYVDPPYLTETRGKWATGGYRHEMRAEDHEALAEVLHQVQGYVVLSGYDSGLYRALYRGWRVERRDTYADRAQPRTEVLWISPNTPPVQPGLFSAS